MHVLVVIPAAYCSYSQLGHLCVHDCITYVNSCFISSFILATIMADLIWMLIIHHVRTRCFHWKLCSNHHIDSGMSVSVSLFCLLPSFELLHSMWLVQRYLSHPRWISHLIDRHNIKTNTVQCECLVEENFDFPSETFDE